MQEPQQPTPEAPKPQIYNYSGQPIALQAICAEAEMGEFGLACSEDDPCPVYLELASIEAAGAKLFVAGNLHTESATLWSILLVSEDAGRSWTEAQQRLRGVALDQLQFPDSATGFAAGRTAGTLPRDPFLLRTADGGNSWRRVPLFEEGAVGLVESLHFESPTQGRVTVDRGRRGIGHYAILETTTSGDTWTVRETSATRVASVAGAPQQDWRITIDAASKSYRIEHRQGTGWSKASAFAVGAGACRPAPRKAPAEPPPQER